MVRQLLPLIAFTLWAAPSANAAGEPPEQALRLVREAAELASNEQYDEALQRLREAQEVAPDYPPAQSWLAHVYELMGDKEQALTHVAALLALQPDDEYGQSAVRRLFYQSPFPRILNAAILGVSPVKFTVDSCSLVGDRVPGTPERLTLCYTTGPKYPEDAGEGGAVRERALPMTEPDAPKARFNRVIYGYQESAGTGELRLRSMAYYPSELLSGRDTDLALLAESLLHIMLRIQCYAGAYLGLPPQGDAEGISRLWLCEGGPGGAERHEADIFVYQVFDEARTPIEWVRQLAHECGHLLIPGIGGFAQPEVWGNGELGERLFVHLLSHEAAWVAGSRWPSDEASARLDGLWPEGHLAAEEYLASVGRAPLNVWWGEGPESDLIVGQGERSMQYYVGFALYILAAHGPAGLREAIKACPGSTVPDFVYSYKQAVSAWAAEGPVAFGPGCYDGPSARVAEAPSAANPTPSSVTLAAGDQVTYLVFLPTGHWSLALPLANSRAECRLLLSFDGSAEAEAIVGAGAEKVLIGPLAEGWHRLRLRAPDEQAPLALASIVFDRGTTT